MLKEDIFREVENITERELKEVRDDKNRNTFEVRYRGFEIYLRYPKDYNYFKDSELDNLNIKDCLVIANVLNNRLKGKGWFWEYVNFCRGLVTGGVVVEKAGNRRLYTSLLAKKEFTRFREYSFYIPSRGFPEGSCST